MCKVRLLATQGAGTGPGEGSSAKYEATRDRNEQIQQEN